MKELVLGRLALGCASNLSLQAYQLQDLPASLGYAAIFMAYKFHELKSPRCIGVDFLPARHWLWLGRQVCSFFIKEKGEAKTGWA